MGKGGKRLVRSWAKVYKKYGHSCFLKTSENPSYNKELKLSVVSEYIQGRGSLSELAIKYNIRAHSTIYTWVLRYTNGEEIKSYNATPEVSMNKTRVTTLEERLEIVEHLSFT